MSHFIVALAQRAAPFANPSNNNMWTVDIGRCAVEAMRRKLVWVERQGVWGWGCSKCVWVFKMESSPIGDSIDEMRKHEQRCDKEFASHVCAEHQRVKNRKVKSYNPPPEGYSDGTEAGI
jgi:hypothetical protein